MTLHHLTTKQKELLEKLAAIEHKRWAHWQRYLHSQCLENDDGSLTIPADLVKKWNKQINTDYFSLTESEKDSDREQVLKYLPLLNSFTITNEK
ncbi:TPA: hypothetical protein JI250_06080 [Acinetobacter baumannii]|uniref:hypothetical protein n=1 Tax=Acinetobacter TaxID=469 RepID=UPI001C5C228B|nr:hypothetical protein [Acinetobacter sp. WU_MDCI_Abxc22]ELT5076313.1 hypothetical protein [Acinetobacter baumannii]MCU4362283.1 hypothetical protein [Acinetobacter sp. WU_MDCI_Abxc22]HAV6057374.1 hypothetical protein [Acinetobacter baumannii]HAV6071759.1 hypothetical protein [Acinetobacter baumannii]HAV6120833.1 hypothetical protein [Acinetobacter baumannii]